MSNIAARMVLPAAHLAIEIKLRKLGAQRLTDSEFCGAVSKFFSITGLQRVDPADVRFGTVALDSLKELSEIDLGSGLRAVRNKSIYDGVTRLLTMVATTSTNPKLKGAAASMLGTLSLPGLQVDDKIKPDFQAYVKAIRR